MLSSTAKCSSSLPTPLSLCLSLSLVSLIHTVPFVWIKLRPHPLTLFPCQGCHSGIFGPHLVFYSCDTPYSLPFGVSANFILAVIPLLVFISWHGLDIHNVKSYLPRAGLIDLLSLLSQGQDRVKPTKHFTLTGRCRVSPRLDSSGVDQYCGLA